MYAMQQGIARRRKASYSARALPAAALLLAAIAAGCSSSIQTPLPDLAPASATSSLSLEEKKKAVDELTKVRATHEQDAEQEIEQAR